MCRVGRYHTPLSLLPASRINTPFAQLAQPQQQIIISILLTITSLLTTNPYVIVIAIDFSKAFDTVRHSSLLQKLAKLDIPDHVYNWILDYPEGHSHSSTVVFITDSPQSYVR